MNEIVTIPTPEIIFTWQFWLTAAACWVLCEIVKNIPGCPKWLVPIVNLVFGVVLLTVLMGWNDGLTLIAGILCSAVADYAFQFFTKIIKGVVGDELEDADPALTEQEGDRKGPTQFDR